MRGLASLVRGESRAISEWDIPWGLGASTGSSVNEITALNLSAVWGCETLIADSIATLPVDTYRKREPVREPTSAPVWVDQPNPECNRVDYETMRVLSLLGWGNAYSLLIRRNGTSDPLDPVVERWILDPWACDARRQNPGAPLNYYVNGNLIPTGNIQHVRGYTLPGQTKGMSVIAQARASMTLSTSAEATATTLFDNGISPGGVLEVPQLPAQASQDVVDRLRETVASRHAGSGNAGKPMVLTGGTTWKQITVNPSDAQFLETRKFQIEEICRWFRVPPHEIQNITDHASQGGGLGIEAQSLNLARRTLTPWVVRLEQADSALLPRGQYVKFNMNAFVRADIKTRHEVYAIKRNIGMSNADELRALEDEQPIVDGGGEEYWRPANMAVVGEEPVVPVVPVVEQDPGVDAGEPE